MADDALVGNMATETILAYLDEKQIKTGINKEVFVEAMQMASTIFPAH
jgi:hydroxymethylglutaryl-CoA lyase